MDATTHDRLLQELTAVNYSLAAAVAPLKAAAQAANTLGVAASRAQGAATAAEFEEPPPALRQRLIELQQRTGFVNMRSAELANRMRDILQGVEDLRGDVAKVLAEASASPRPEG